MPYYWSHGPFFLMVHRQTCGFHAPIILLPCIEGLTLVVRLIKLGAAFFGPRYGGVGGASEALGWTEVGVQLSGAIL